MKKNAPSAVEYSDLINTFNWISIPSDSYDKLSGKRFENFNNINFVNANSYWNNSNAFFDYLFDLCHENKEKKSYICIQTDGRFELKSPLFYFKETSEKLKAYPNSPEPTIPVYEVFSNIISFDDGGVDLLLWDEQLEKIDELVFPSSSILFSGSPPFSNVKFKFKIALPVDADNLGWWENPHAIEPNITDPGIKQAINGLSATGEGKGLGNDPNWQLLPDDYDENDFYQLTF